MGRLGPLHFPSRRLRRPGVHRGRRLSSVNGRFGPEAAAHSCDFKFLVGRQLRRRDPFFWEGLAEFVLESFNASASIAG